MGRTIAGRFLADGKVDLVAAVDPAAEGKSVGGLAGTSIQGPTIVADVADLPDSIVADIALDFSTAAASRLHIEHCLKRGWDILIGVTGFAENDYASFASLAEKYSRRVVVVPNFSLGVNLLLRFAQDAARVFGRVEIIELHHDKKTDAPSGTAIHTAGTIARARRPPPHRGPDDPSRGRSVDGIPVHAVRLPGLLAHQEVIFGGEGEVLTIRHDTTDRSAFLSGIYLAIEHMPSLPPGFVRGLDWVFEGRASSE
jgi:4-hydroxy-tetrahydrodipicolinate reductase